MKKPTIKEIKEAHSRRIKTAKGLRLKFINQVCLELYAGAQNAKLN